MKKILISLTMLGLIVPAMAYAATFESPAEKDGILSFEKNETVKNLYAAGNTVNFSGRSLQDVVIAGNNLNISGSTGSSLMAAGNTVNISGPVGSSARIVGANINIQKSIGSDLIAAGSSVILSPEATVGDDLIAAGATIDLLGKVNGNARLAGGQININGEVNGNVIIKGSGKVSIGDNAVINGSLDYQSTQAASISPNAKILGETKFTQISNRDQKFAWGKIAGLAAGFSLLMFIATFLALWLLSYLFPNLLRRLVDGSLVKPLENLGIGLVYLIVVPIASFILLATIIGIPLGVLLLGLYIIAIGLAKLFTPVFVGSYLFKWLGKDKSYRIDWLVILVGLIVATIVGLIPVLGSLVLFIIFLLVLSQIAQRFVGSIRASR